MSTSDFELPETKPAKPRPAVKQVTQPAPDNFQDVNAVGNQETTSQDPEYSKEELLRVFDEIIFSGEYREDILIRGKVPVTFRTRTAEEISEIQKVIDSSGSNLISTVENIRSLLNLKYSLVSYRGHDLSMKKDGEKMAFIEKLPGPIVGMLLMRLSKFDDKVGQACREGEENF